MGKNVEKNQEAGMAWGGGWKHGHYQTQTAAYSIDQLRGCCLFTTTDI